jgi:dipeptidase
MEFEYEGELYVCERATATQQTGFWFVAQARNFMPDELGGILWFGVDDAALSSLTPIYCGTTEVPECLREGNGNLTEYSDTAAFWIFNRVSQFAYLRYDYIGAEVRRKIDQWENDKLVEVMAFEEKMSGASKSKRVKEATRFSVDTAQEMFDTWVALDKYLMVKYMDGNIKKEDANGFKDNGEGMNIPAMPDQPGYSDKWKEAVVRDHGDVLRVVK